MAVTRRRSGALRAGLETYDLETSVGAGPYLAAAAAITAATRVHEVAVLRRVSRAALVVSSSLLAEPGGRYSSHAAAITWFADKHVHTLPELAAADEYQPAPGDIIEVTLTGPVLTTEVAGTWTLVDRLTGRSYRFGAPGTDGAPNMMVLDTAWPAPR